MVFDFRLGDAAIFEAMRTLGERGGMLQLHCEDPVLIDAAVEAALQRGNTSPRYHATTRSPEAEAVATAPGDGVRPGGRCARPRRPPVVRGGARDVAEAKAAGVRAHAETCPHYLTLTDERYDDPDPADVRPLRHLAAAPPGRRPRRAVGGPGRRPLDLVATDHVPDRLAVEKGDAANGVPFDRISNGAPGIETLLAIVYRRRRRDGPTHDRADGRRPRDDAGPAVRARSARARSRPAATPTSSCSIRRPGGRSAPRTSTTRATTRRTRASRSPAPSAPSSSAAGPSSVTAPSSASEALERSSNGAMSTPDAPGNPASPGERGSRRVSRAPVRPERRGTRRTRRRGRADRGAPAASARRAPPAGPPRRASSSSRMAR